MKPDDSYKNVNIKSITLFNYSKLILNTILNLHINCIFKYKDKVYFNFTQKQKIHI